MMQCKSYVKRIVWLETFQRASYTCSFKEIMNEPIQADSDFNELFFPSSMSTFSSRVMIRNESGMESGAFISCGSDPHQFDYVAITKQFKDLQPMVEIPNDASECTDSDNDGVGDNADAFPDDASETMDSDNDGIGDNADVFPNDVNESFSDNHGVG